MSDIPSISSNAASRELFFDEKKSKKIPPPSFERPAGRRPDEAHPSGLPLSGNIKFCPLQLPCSHHFAPTADRRNNAQEL